MNDVASDLRSNSRIIATYRERTPGSASLAKEAGELFPSGITHDARNVDPYCVFIQRAAGPHKWDVDGNRYIDYFGGHGALLLGNNSPASFASDAAFMHPLQQTNDAGITAQISAFMAYFLPPLLAGIGKREDWQVFDLVLKGVESSAYWHGSMCKIGGPRRRRAQPRRLRLIVVPKLIDHRTLRSSGD